MRQALCAFVLFAMPVHAVGQQAGDTLNERFDLIAADGEDGDGFGHAVAVDGDRLVVGSFRDEIGPDDTGSAYVFDRATGKQIRKLVASDGADGDAFGAALAADGGVAVVGAPLVDAGEVLNVGAAYVYDLETGAELFRLASPNPRVGDRFGSWVALADGVIVVSAPYEDTDIEANVGAVYLFDLETGDLLRTLTADDGGADDDFGVSLALADGVVAVGARTDADDGLDSGAVYLFDRDTGEQLRKITAGDGAAGDEFGFNSIALSGGVLAVPAWKNDANGEDSGAVYLFDVSTGDLLRKITPEGGSADDGFGRAVGLHGDTLAVSALTPGSLSQTGAAYVFAAESGEQIARLERSEVEDEDLFGFSIAAGSDTVVVGARNGEGVEGGSGVASVFDLAGDDCPADWDGNGIVNAADVGAFLSDYFLDQLNGTFVADFNDDGVVNAADVGAFLSEYFPNQGACP